MMRPLNQLNPVPTIEAALKTYPAVMQTVWQKNNQNQEKILGIFITNAIKKPLQGMGH